MKEPLFNGRVFESCFFILVSSISYKLGVIKYKSLVILPEQMKEPFLFIITSVPKATKYQQDTSAETESKLRHLEGTKSTSSKTNLT